MQQNEKADLQQLVEIAGRLHPAQIQLLLEVVGAMSREVVEVTLPESDIVTTEFALSFRNRLLIHHATNEAKLSKKPFEYAFRGASEAAGRKAFITSNTTNPGADVIVDGVPFSLKTESSKKISKSSVHISKFSEGRYIQQCGVLDALVAETIIRFPAHLANYNRILSLRSWYFNKERTQVYYELLEIPCNILREVENLTITDFTARTPQGGSTAKVIIGGQQAFSLRLDGSDGKVTIASLKISPFCTRHASWIVPTVSPLAEEN